jgi:hypothetical protein
MTNPAHAGWGKHDAGFWQRLDGVSKEHPATVSGQARRTGIHCPYTSPAIQSRDPIRAGHPYLYGYVAYVVGEHLR